MIAGGTGAGEAVREALTELDLDWHESEPGLFSVTPLDAGTDGQDEVAFYCPTCAERELG